MNKLYPNKLGQVKALCEEKKEMRRGKKKRKEEKSSSKTSCGDSMRLPPQKD